MKIIDTEQLTIELKEKILKLWNQEYPEKLKLDGLPGLEKYLAGVKEQNHFFLTDNTDNITGWAFTFLRENEKWFAIILNKEFHHLGYGTLLLSELKAKEIKLNGWVIDQGTDKKQNGESYISPLDFYLKNGFVIIPGVRMEMNKISGIKIQWSK